LLSENKRLVKCVYIPIRNEGAELLHKICFKEEMERKRARLKRRMVIVTFQVKGWKLLHLMMRV
jgi:hypothetical protein